MRWLNKTPKNPGECKRQLAVDMRHRQAALFNKQQIEAVEAAEAAVEVPHAEVPRCFGVAARDPGGW